MLSAGGNREDELDAWGKWGREALDDLRAEVVFELIQAIEEQNERLFGGRQEGEEG